MRRCLFEEIDADLRKKKEARQDSHAIVYLYEHLMDIMEKARVEQHSEAAVKIAMDLGAALVSELPGIAFDIARQVGMKSLEQKRFLQYCGGAPVAEAVKAKVTCVFDDVDSFDIPPEEWYPELCVLVKILGC